MTFLPSWAWLVAGCVSVSLAGASNPLDLHPPLWNESPSQISDYKMEDGKYLVDPWIFTQRMGMYKILMQQTAPYFEKFGPENEQNVLWGLPVHFGWQYTSGRLADPSTVASCGSKSDPLCISVDSWWADLNYYLSVLPFLAAIDSGIMGISSEKVTLLPPPKNQTRFCYDVTDCLMSYPDIMNKWNAFFQYIQLPSSNFDELLHYLWRAHTSSCKNSVKIFEDRYAYYHQQEAEYEQNWIVFLDYLAASRIPPTFFRMYNLQNGLPPRILVGTDAAPFIADFTDFQNMVQLVVNTAAIIHRSTGSFSLAAWKILMSTQNLRREFLELFDELLQLMN